MDIMELGAIGELIGGVAVIGSLIYVGLQVRQSTEQTRQSNAIERARATRETTRDANDIIVAMREPEVYGQLRESLANFDSLSPDDQAAVSFRFLLPLLLHAVATFLSAQDELVEETYAERWVLTWASVVKCQGVASWWTEAKVLIHPHFAAEVDRLAASATGPPPLNEIYSWLAVEA